ncbi:hypothetical protein CsSME_00002280 [Camellia sinensis var. sinensis]
MTLNASASASASATATFAKPLCPRPRCKTLVKKPFLLCSSRLVFITNSRSKANSKTLTTKPNKLKFRLSTCRASTSSFNSVQLPQQQDEEDDPESTRLFEVAVSLVHFPFQ